MSTTLSNQHITIRVSSHGAELTSLVYQGREYLWQANPEYWKRHSPVLFPIVGSVWDGHYHSQGHDYTLGQHGFARDMQFQLLTHSADEVFYLLESSTQTHTLYPYDFRLEIGYRLRGKSVEVIWRVINTTTSAIHFQIGAHPAFYWPMLSSFERTDLKAMENHLATTDQRGYFSFGLNAPLQLQATAIVDKGCVDINTHHTYSTSPDGRLPLTVDTFDHDALVLEDSQVSQVTLHDQQGNPYLTLTFPGAPVVGLWSPPHKRAPFVCIEPWYGRCDRTNYHGDYEQKDWMQHLDAGQTFEASYFIELH